MVTYNPDARRLPGLHGLRGFAALIIVIYHVADIPPVPVPSLISWFMPELQLGVHLFFVLSALSLLHTHAPNVGASGWVVSYAIKRYFRIAPLFYFMILIWYASAERTGVTLAANLLFVFNLDRQTFGSIVPAGWAVGVEMLFYATLPAILLLVRTVKAACALFATCLTVSLVSRLLLVSEDGERYEYAIFALPSNLAFFAAGVLVWTLLRRPLKWQAIGWVSVIAMIGLAAGQLLVIHRGMPLALLWAAPLAAVCGWQAVSPSRWLASEPMQWLGERSFSIYLLHPLIIIALGWFDVYDRLYSSGVGFVGCCIVTLGIVMPASDVTFRFIERPGQRAGVWLIRRLYPNVTHAAPVQSAPE